MKRLVIPLLLVAILVVAGCAKSSARGSGIGKLRSCPSTDLTVPCGRTATGKLFRL